jgi:hypothetical protein
MSLKDVKDKLEIGLKPDAPYRPGNLPESELDDPATRDKRERQRESTASATPPHGDPLRSHVPPEQEDS